MVRVNNSPCRISITTNRRSIRNTRQCRSAEAEPWYEGADALKPPAAAAEVKSRRFSMVPRATNQQRKYPAWGGRSGARHLASFPPPFVAARKLVPACSPKLVDAQPATSQGAAEPEFSSRLRHVATTRSFRVRSRGHSESVHQPARCQRWATWLPASRASRRCKSAVASVLEVLATNRFSVPPRVARC